MSVEINPVGTHCGMGCAYCYQLPVRQGSKNARPPRVDHAAVQVAVRSANPGAYGFSLFGGEPLLASLEDLEKLWAFGLQEYGHNGVQTAGADITEAHYELFKRYKVHAGFSIDGPGDLNGARRYGTPEQTRRATARSVAWLERCLTDGVPCSLIVTLHRLNAAAAGLPELIEWFRALDERGLRNARLHVLEQDGPGGAALALTSAETVDALWALHGLETGLQQLHFDVFRDMHAKLRDPEASASCVWNWCDPWTTPAVHGINADGSRSLCQRVHKDGKTWQPMDGAPTRLRQVVLWNTPQDRGGCQGCRFFLQCGGQCPGTAIDGDWRKRSVDCPTWFELFQRLEAEMVGRGEAPASLRPELETRIAARLAAWQGGDVPHGDSHGDAPHGDEHGDHADQAAAEARP